MRIKDIIQGEGRSLSFEFFPPKTEEAEGRLFGTIKKLEIFKPSFVSVTYGAGGGTRETTRRVAERIIRETSLTPMPHLTCINQSESELRGILRGYKELGIENILALRGDLSKGEKIADLAARKGLGYGRDLVQLAASFAAFSIGVAVYPEGHCKSLNLEMDMLYTKEKIEAGADFAITQMFFDNRFFYDFMERAERVGIRVPIIAGIMPVTDIEKIKQFAGICGATLPAVLVRRVENEVSPQEVERIGIEFTTKQIDDLLQNGVRLFHFYTLNHAEAVTKVLLALSLDRLLGKRVERAIEIGTRG